MTHARRAVVAVVAASILLLAPSMARAQESKSAALAAELVKLLDQLKLDSLAAKVAAPDQFVATLYFPGSQLLVVGAKYYVPERMDYSIGEKKYRDVYIDLNSAAVPKTKIFISDLGANGLQVFFSVTLPKIKWSLLYGVILCNARAMGEFGAVSVVSGHIRGVTNTMPLQVEILYNEYNFVGAFAVASLLTLLALVTLIVKKLAERKEGFLK